MNYQEELDKMNQEQINSNGWCGCTDVELAKRIFLSIDYYISPEDKPKYTWKIARCLQAHRSY